MIIQDLFELRKSRTFDVFYSGGDFAINSTGDILFTTCGSVIKALNVNDGSERFIIGNADEESRVSSLVLSEDDLEIILAYSNDVLKRYALTRDGATLLHQFRGTHSAPVQILKLLSGSNILATGGADYSVKVWNLKTRQCTHTFRGKSVVSALCFVEKGDKLVAGYTEGQIVMFNLKEKVRDNRHLHLNAHTSRITALISIASATNTPFGLVSFSCDQTASILNAKTLQRLNYFSLNEIVEGAVYLGGHDLEVLTVGDQGKIRIWSLKNTSKVREADVSRSSLVNVACCKNSNTVICSTAECDLFFVDLKSLRVSKQFSGFNDEIYESCFLSERLNCLAVASNAPDLRIYNLASYCCHLVQGHTESILSVDSPDWDDYLLATSSKDNSIGVWRVSPGFDLEQYYKIEDRPFVQRLAIGTGHTNSVSCVKFSHLKSSQFLVSVSADSTLKIWSLNGLKDDDEPQKLTCSQTFVAHSKDVNSVDVSLNDKLCVTASMDKTAKLWHIDPNTLILGIAGTLSGHKRGVWSAKFSKTRQVVATCSGDCTIKIFSLLDKSCIQTLSGHAFAVLSVLFVEDSNRLLSADGGGLLKVWDLDDGVCEKTIEAHSDKIWSINMISCTQNLSAEVDITDEEKEELKQKSTTRRYVTVGSDSEVIIWDDISAEVKTEKIKTEAKRLADVQSLQNYVQQEKFGDALLLTIDLAQPYQCLKVIKKMFERQKKDEKFVEELRNVLHSMSPLQISILLGFASQWNTNTKHCHVSQVLLNHILRSIPPQEFLKLPNVENLVRSFLPYSNRMRPEKSKKQTLSSVLTVDKEIIELEEPAADMPELMDLYEDVSNSHINGILRSVAANNESDDDDEKSQAYIPIITSKELKRQSDVKGESHKFSNKSKIDTDVRSIPIPAHRRGVLKRNWVNIMTPVVKQLNLQIRYNLKTRNVEIRCPPDSSNKSQLQKAADFVRAFVLGFSIDDAIALIRLDHLFLESFEVNDVKTLRGDNLSRAIGRIAGKDGRTKLTIENVTKTRIVLADTKVHLLGAYQNLRIARHTICSLIMGTPPNKIYGNLRNLSSRMAERL